MALPTVVGVGTPAGGAGDVTPTKHASTTTGDDCWLAIEANGNQVPLTLDDWTLVDSSVGAGAGSTGIAVFHQKEAGQGNPTITDVGNHLFAVILTTRGGHATSPANASADDREEAVDTSGSSPGLTTTVNECLVVDFVATSIDSTTPTWADWANASLANLAEVFEGGTDAGSGGGIAINTGEKATAGTVNATTVTTPNDHKAFVKIAIAPAAGSTDATVTLPAAGIVALTSVAPALRTDDTLALPAAGIMVLTAAGPTINLSPVVSLPAAGIIRLAAGEPILSTGTNATVTLPAAGIIRLTATAPVFETVSGGFANFPLIVFLKKKGFLK